MYTTNFDGNNKKKLGGGVIENYKSESDNTSENKSLSTNEIIIIVFVGIICLAILGFLIKNYWMNN